MKNRITLKILLVALVFLAITSVSSTARAEWQFGIGTGLMFMNAEGDMGLHLIAPDESIQFEMKMDPDDFSDLTESAFGFGGFATDGKWMILYSFSNLKLEGSETFVHNGVGGDTTIDFFTEFDMTGGELVVGYPVYQGDSATFRLYTGVRYTGHELTGGISAAGVINGDWNREIDEDWTDALIGFMADVRLAEKWGWSTRFDGGFGGSEGTYFVSTGVNWRFHEHWSATLYGRYSAVDFENSTKGEDDWYLYDVDESGVGLTIMFIW